MSPAVDPISGEPEFKHTPARVAPFVVDWYAFVLTRRPLESLEAAWWTLVKGECCLRYELAGRVVPPDLPGWSRRLLGATTADSDYLDYHDEAAGIYRGARLLADRLEACICVSGSPQLPPRGWLSSLFARSSLAETERTAVLAGRPLGERPDAGPLVCACFGVGREAIRRAIRTAGLVTPQEIGARLKAGTNCGSCLPEIRTLILETAS